MTATHLAAALPVNQGGTATTAPGFAALTDGATVTWAIGSALVSNKTLLFTTHGGSRTLNITGPISGGSYVLRLTQDATGGEGLTRRELATRGLVSGGGSGAVTLSTGAGAVDVLAFMYDVERIALRISTRILTSLALLLAASSLHAQNAAFFSSNVAAAGGVKVTDNFMRADSDPIGAPWTASPTLCTMAIVSDAAQPSAGLTTQCAEFYAGVFPANQKSIIIATELAAGFSYGGPTVRMDTMGNGYIAMFGGSADPNTYVEKRVSATCTPIGAAIAYTFFNWRQART